jgi:hypothetical protein
VVVWVVELIFEQLVEQWVDSPYVVAEQIIELEVVVLSEVVVKIFD